MAKPVALIAADLHISRHAWARRPGIAGDADFALGQLARLAKEYSVNQVLLLGDLFDTPRPDVRDVSSLLHLVEDLARDHIVTVFILGQHDQVRRGLSLPVSWPVLTQKAHHAHATSFDVGPFRAYGLDFRSAEELPEALDKIPRDTDLLLTHQAWQEHLPPGARVEGSLADIPHACWVLTGDLHAHRSHTLLGKDHQEIQVLSPGSLFLQSLDEDPQKYVYLLQDDGSFFSASLPGRALHRFRILHAMQLEELLDRRPEDWLDTTLPAELQKPIVHVRYRPAVSRARSRLLSSLGEVVHLFLTPLEEKPDGEDFGGVENALPVGLPVDEVVVQVLRQRCGEDEDLLDLATRLLQASRPQDVLEEWVERIQAR